jgi:alkylation response protein AidB-like acyl-CoA dehydrogenase
MRPRKRAIQTDQTVKHYFDLTSEQRDLRERVRAYVQEYVAPGADETDRLSRFPEQAVARAAELGLLGLLVPREHGGLQAGHVAFVIFVEEVAYACAASAVIMDVHSSVATEPIVLRGNEAQQRRYLPLLASGRVLGAFALTEPEAGSDAASLKTTAVRDGDHYVLNGAKTFITNAGHAGLYTVMAATDRAKGARGISAFLVEAGTPGLAVGAPLHKLGLHGSPTCELFLRDCRVPPANRLGEEGEGFKIAMLALDSGRIGISAQAIGLARAALGECIAALTESGKRVSQGAQFALADMATAIEAARALTWRAARLCDLGRPFSAAAAMAKLCATDTAMQVTSEAMALAGHGSGARLARLDRFVRDAKATQLYEGTNQIQRLVIARSIVGTRPESESGGKAG